MTLEMCRKYLIATGKFSKYQVLKMRANQVMAIWYRLTGESNVPKYNR